MHIRPFTIDTPRASLDDLERRLRAARWPDEAEGAGWSMGVSRGYLSELVAYWLNGFDWQATQARLNAFPQHSADIDGLDLHVIHVRGKGPNPTPLLLLHGWPDSFYRYIKVLPLLADPARFGGDAEQSFDVIVPSLPGFGFSARPTAPGGMRSLATAERLARLMTEGLGYDNYLISGGDIGARVARLLAIAHPEQLLGLHLTDIGFPREVSFPPEITDLTPAEQRFLGSTQGWFMQEGGYAMVQSSRPQTLAYGLNDSPIGLAAWIVDKFRAWSDCDGQVERRFSKDDVLTNVMLYWLTETISSSTRLYYDDVRCAPQLRPGQRIDVPTAVTLFPRDFTRPPREMAERFLNVVRWTELPAGGHFTALEEPEAFAAELVAFAATVRRSA